MNVLDIFQAIVSDVSPIILLCRAMVTATWSLALFQIWKARNAPMANQAFFAAFSIVLGEILLIFYEHLPMEVLTFFVSMAQVVMAISIVKIFRWSSHLTLPEQYRIQASENYRQHKEGLLKTYGSSILTVALAGVIYFTLVWLEAGHI